MFCAPKGGISDSVYTLDMCNKINSEKKLCMIWNSLNIMYVQSCLQSLFLVLCIHCGGSIVKVSGFRILHIQIIIHKIRSVCMCAQHEEV